MYIEHLDAVKERIAEIRNRFPDIGNSSPVQCSRPSADMSFSEVLSKATTAKQMSCPGEYESMIASAAKENGLDPAAIKAVISAESGWRQNAVSRVGAVGLMQLMPGTARSLGVDDPTDPAQNIQGGARCIKQLKDRFGSMELALAAYNAGPGAVARYGGIPPYKETQRYVDKVMEYMKSYADQ